MPTKDSAPHHALDLYRTINLSQIHPALRTRNAELSRFTEVVPLYCAALTEKKADYPPYFTNGNNAVQIRGASLHWYKRFDTETTIMSWEDIFCK
jgi:hypothetical protein